MAKKNPFEGSAAEEAAETPAQEKAEVAKGDPKGATVSALKSGTGGSTKKRQVKKG